MQAKILSSRGERKNAANINLSKSLLINRVAKGVSLVLTEKYRIVSIKVVFVMMKTVKRITHV